MAKKAFTLVEIVVAVALLAMVISFSSVVFKLSVDSHRTAAANAEVMQKLRAVTEQLNSDFKGLCTDAPLLLWFDYTDANRLDQIMFFSVGDFQSSQLYSDQSSDRKPTSEYDEQYKYVRGNAARIYYGLARSRDRSDTRHDMNEPYKMLPPDRVLARRQHILTADGDLYRWPDVNDTKLKIDDNTISGINGRPNEIFEHDRLSLAQWKAVSSDAYNGNDGIIKTCFYNRNDPNGFPIFDSKDPNTFHKLLCEGVADFAVQWCYTIESNDAPRWFPTSGSNLDMSSNSDFGVYFNISGSITENYWYDPNDTSFKNKSFTADTDDIVPNNTNKGFFPEALKFTFRLCDSQGIIKETAPNGETRPGRTFTHIVRLRN